MSKCNKLQVYCSIPPELAELTWSCRTPLYSGGKPLPCGKCHACESRSGIMQKLKKPA
jgi:7-cyano-7-deazaguanine synthase in queuosine biosynthesis